ncbi:hypothetical protein EJ04DRAFT_149552 [Polyplosphaeria fusca]|uniref:Uncharacterized protein n=1 Tax=Polyplosphaeria fusca TaxID=682080 RepID=A0A9P4V5T9_9PLEO|nr:hypothetical protein EJ04DRAFT_149552 [Polyplosphaeria fusca]
MCISSEKVRLGGGSKRAPAIECGRISFEAESWPRDGGEPRLQIKWLQRRTLQQLKCANRKPLNMSSHGEVRVTEAPGQAVDEMSVPELGFGADADLPRPQVHLTSLLFSDDFMYSPSRYRPWLTLATDSPLPTLDAVNVDVAAWTAAKDSQVALCQLELRECAGKSDDKVKPSLREKLLQAQS